jgi:hypothetical protein
MSALTDSVTAITAELVSYDAAVATLATLQASLAQNQADTATAIGNQTLSVADRAAQVVLLNSAATVLQSDISLQTQVVAGLKAQIIADSTDLQSRLRGELAGKVAALKQSAIAQLQTDYDTTKIFFPVTQIAAAHRDVLALKVIENNLSMYRPGDGAYIDFARGAGALLTQIDS